MSGVGRWLPSSNRRYLDIERKGKAVIEDKLSHDERLRLECIAQSVAGTMHDRPWNAEAIVARARTFEEYVREGDKR